MCVYDEIYIRYIGDYSVLVGEKTTIPSLILFLENIISILLM